MSRKSVRYGRRREYQCEMNVNARGGSDIQAEMENAVKSLRVYALSDRNKLGIIVELPV